LYNSVLAVTNNSRGLYCCIIFPVRRAFSRVKTPIAFEALLDTNGILERPANFAWRQMACMPYWRASTPLVAYAYDVPIDFPGGNW